MLIAAQVHQSVGVQADTRADADGDEADELGALRQRVLLAALERAEVVEGAEHRQAGHSQQRQSDRPAVDEVCHDREDGDHHDDEQPAHGRRAGLDVVRLRAPLADLLADVEPAEQRDGGVAGDCGGYHGDRSECESIGHLATSASATLSRPTAREALMRQ